MSRTYEHIDVTAPAYEPIFVRCVGYITLLMDIVTIYVIYFYTPSHMKNYKMYIINLQMSTACLNAYMTLLADPIPVSGLGGYCNGPLTFVFGITGHIQMVVLIIFIMATISALFCCFICRHQTVLPPSSPFKLNKIMYRCLLIFTHICFFVPIPYLFYLSGVPNDVAIKFITEGAQDAIDLIKQKGFMFYDYWIIPTIMGFIYAFGILIIVTSVIISILVIDSFRCIRKHTHGLHKEKQRSLMLLLLAQALCPVVLLATPVFILLAYSWFTLYTRTPIAICMCIISLHSPCNTLIILFGTKSYRKILLQWARIPFRHRSNSHTTVSILSANRI